MSDPFVARVVDRVPLTELGQIFRMDRYHADHPDGGYQVVNKVQVIDPPRTIGWLTGYEKGDGSLQFGGWIWRYDLAPLGPSETVVMLTYDWSAMPQFVRERGIQFPPFGTEHLPNSLHHLGRACSTDIPGLTPDPGKPQQNRHTETPTHEFATIANWSGAD